jgi:glycosyltransferase involved in cell wall biosynthesis
MAADLQLSVVIPGFNEAENIGGVVVEALATLDGCGRSFEIVVVNDGSTDNTADVLAGLAARSRHIKVVTHPVNRGMGAALRTGLQNSRGSLITWIPSDGQFDLAEVLWQLPLMDSCDLAIALRTGVPRTWRLAITACFHFLIWLMFRFRVGDMCGIFIVHRSILDRVMPLSDNVFFTVEFPILALKHGKRVKEFTVTVKLRRGGASKVANLRSFLRVFIEMVKVRFR